LRDDDPHRFETPLVQDVFHGFAPKPPLAIAGASEGPLRDKTFAVKDLSDVMGCVIGCGNPDWARTHVPARRSATAVECLLGAGATLVRDAITDEMTCIAGLTELPQLNLLLGQSGTIPVGSAGGAAIAHCSLSLAQLRRSV
jgi:amidase